MPLKTRIGIRPLSIRRVGQPEIENDEIDPVEIAADAGEQLDRTAHDHGAMAGFFECCSEAVAHEAGVVGDNDGLGDHRRPGHRLVVSVAGCPTSRPLVARPRLESL